MDRTATKTQLAVIDWLFKGILAWLAISLAYVVLYTIQATPASIIILCGFVCGIEYVPWLIGTICLSKRDTHGYLKEGRRAHVLVNLLTCLYLGLVVSHDGMAEAFASEDLFPYFRVLKSAALLTVNGIAKMFDPADTFSFFRLLKSVALLTVAFGFGLSCGFGVGHRWCRVFRRWSRSGLTHGKLDEVEAGLCEVRFAKILELDRERRHVVDKAQREWDKQFQIHGAGASAGGQVAQSQEKTY